VTDELLEQIDLVGFVERMAPTVLMLADALGLQHMPSQLYSNHGHGKPQHDGEMWSAAGFKTTRATRDAKTAAQPLLAASNDCSIALYKKWLYKFDQRVREQPTSFHARMASVPTTRPKMRARDPSGDNLGRPRSGRQAQNEWRLANAHAAGGGAAGVGEQSQKLAQMQAFWRARQQARAQSEQANKGSSEISATSEFPARNSGADAVPINSDSPAAPTGHVRVPDYR